LKPQRERERDMCLLRQKTQNNERERIEYPEKQRDEIDKTALADEDRAGKQRERERDV
jgi:hypothetical protein